jgi:hypothetical protein
MTEETEKSNPLWLPAGSVRALLALSVVVSFIAICVKTGNTEALAAIAVMISKDYFQNRSQSE